jgi:nucleotide-binding universal stress UspA family protein
MEAARTFVEKLKKMAGDAGVESEGKVIEGHPSEEILNEAESSKVDLIVMSSHGRRALAAAVIGSVSINVLHGAQVPVTIVPAHQ